MAQNPEITAVTAVPLSKALPKPDWLKVRAPGGQNYTQLKDMMRSRKLATVCEEARCPNIGECWSGGTATIMVMGDTCTRGCRFCNVKTGNPRGALDADEPKNVAQSLHEMNLEYVVITTVDRDDLPDQGAAHFAAVVSQVKAVNPELLVETLAGDFQGKQELLKVLIDSGLDVFSHNIETVERLSPKIRDRRANYRQSLMVLKRAKEMRPSLITKSSIMVGFGETKDEVLQAMRDLRSHNVDILTLGQYMQPSRRHLPVEEFLPPAYFKELELAGLAMGFVFVASGPLVRSSYRAGEFFLKNYLKDRYHQRFGKE
jgi:lipoyl synthase